MIATVKKILARGKLKKDLAAFLNELEKNLELFYVMDQRQFITQGFSTNAWERVKGMEMVKKYEAIGLCMRTLEGFNRLFKEHKEFEKWYAADMANKTKENALKLHHMKQDLEAQLKGIEGSIILAGQALEKDMLATGLLKP